MRNHYTLEIRRPKGSEKIPMHCTHYQGEKVFNAISHALAGNDVDEIIWWLDSPLGQVKVNRTDFHKISKSKQPKETHDEKQTTQLSENQSTRRANLRRLFYRSTVQ